MPGTPHLVDVRLVRAPRPEPESSQIPGSGERHGHLLTTSDDVDLGCLAESVHPQAAVSSPWTQTRACSGRRTRDRAARGRSRIAWGAVLCSRSRPGGLRCQHHRRLRLEHEKSLRNHVCGLRDLQHGGCLNHLQKPENQPRYHLIILLSHQYSGFF